MTSSLNRFNRAFDSLKKVVSKNPQEINRQKLKFTSCATLTELVCKSNDKSSLLTIAVTSLIQLLDNADFNNRLIIDESLNKIIRSSLDNASHIAKVLIALLKILSKNTNERCLKAALWRFSELTHFVRPHKGKIYVQTLVPVFVKLAARKEENIHETLVSSFPRIFQYIGLFTSDNDVKTLLKAFLKNLSSETVEIRRAAAFIITVICHYSRKPQSFFLHTLSTLLELIIDTRYHEQGNLLLVQGCLSCVRHILSYITNSIYEYKNEFEMKYLEHLLQIYEICFVYASYRDHNVITASLETLHQLLLAAPSVFIEKLISTGSLVTSTLTKRANRGSTLSLAAQSDVFSVCSTIAHTDDDIFSGELGRKMNALRRNSESFPDISEEQKQKWTENWVQEQKKDDNDDDVSSSSLLNMNTSHFANSDDEDNRYEVDSMLSFRAVSVDNIQAVNEMNEADSLNQSKLKFQSIKSISVMSSASLTTSFNNLSMDLDIGDLLDEKEIPLHYCARFLVTRFLIFNKEEGVRRIRVSVMSLAISCLAQLLKLHPASAFITVLKDKEIFNDYTSILEVLLSHVTHDDQQIRGLVRVVIGNVITASLIVDNYLLAENDYHLLNRKLLKELVVHLQQGLEDDSSVCIRHCLQGVAACLQPLLLTPEYKCVIPMLDSIFTLIDNPYWLIKTKILEIFENISYHLLFFVADECSLYQDKIFHKVILPFLEDPDGRVRHAAAQCLLKYVINAYYPMDHNYELVATTFAKKFCSGIEILYSLEGENAKSISEIQPCVSVDRSLARIVHNLSQNFASSSKNVVIGYSEALSILANAYPPIKYAESWQCRYFLELHSATCSYSPCELFATSLLLMTNSSLILNFDVHLHLLTLTSQLFIALCNSNVDVHGGNCGTSSERLWSYLVDEKLKGLAELFLRHLMRLSTIFSDVVTDVTVKSSVPVSSSGIAMHPVPIDQPLVVMPQSPMLDANYLRQSKGTSDIRVDGKSGPIGQYSRDARYLKLKVALKSAYSNYQVTLKPESSEKFVSFLETLLNSFGTVIDFLTICEVDRLCKEFLRHLRNFMIFLPVSSVRCVVQLFKCVFGTNKISVRLLFNEAKTTPHHGDDDCSNSGFYTYCFQRPYNDLSTFFKMKQHRESESRNEWELPRSPPRSPVMKHKRSVNMNSFPAYIKLFEPNVIQSLKQYTVASDTTLQAEVLHLLSELIQVKVNYCLLDSEQVFIKFLLSQFQLIEEEQLQVVDKLLPAMFDFLIHLANEKHSRPIMSVPKVIQLCDSLTASVQSMFHCILAIEPVVKHVFTKFTAIANTEEIKELETQQDVLFSILLRLMYNPKSLPLLTIVLNNSGEEQKLRRSTQITPILFNALVERRISADRESRAYIFELLFALHPASFGDQLLLSTLFNLYHCNKNENPSTWTPFGSLLLLVILSKYEENTILFGVKKQLNHPIFNEENTNDVKITDPLCATVGKMTDVSAQTAFAQFLCRMLTIAFQNLQETKLYENSFEKIMFLRELLLIFAYVIKSGKFENIHRELIRGYVNEEEYNWIFEITRLSYILLTIHPIVALQWYELLLYLRDKSGELRWYFGLSSIRFNSGGLANNVCNVERQSISNDAIRIGVFLLAAECQDEFIVDREVLRGFLENNFFILLNCLVEEPVRKLMANIRNTTVASNLLVEIVRKMFDELLIEDNKLIVVLRLLDYAHDDAQGNVLLLCCRPNFLNSSSFLIREQAFTSANRIISSLSVIEDRVLFETRLTQIQLQSLIEKLKLSKSVQSEILLNSLHDVALKLFGIEIPVCNFDFTKDLDNLRSTVITKEWFSDEMKKKCCDENERDYCKLSTLLCQLPLVDVLNIMEDKNFNRKILQRSFDVSVQLHLEKCTVIAEGSVPELPPLFVASRLILLRLIDHVMSPLPQIHEVYWPVGRKSEKREMQYSQRMDSLFSNEQFFESVERLIAAVENFAASAERFSSSVDLESVVLLASLRVLADFAVLCSQFAHWQIRNHRRWSKAGVGRALQCCCALLKIKPVLALVSAPQIGSVISAMFSASESHFNETIKLPPNPILEKYGSEDAYPIFHSGHVVSTLIDYFMTKVLVRSSTAATSLDFLLKELLVLLSRSDFVYSYVRIPLEIWKHISETFVVRADCLTLNTIPENFLQDSDVLRNFVSRLMFIGWNNRLQFEECWMLLLIAFNSLPEDESSEEEVEILSQVNIVAVSAVSSILVQTMYDPCPGDKILPKLFHVSRYNNFHPDRCGKKEKLYAVNRLLSLKCKDNCNFVSLFNNVNVNLEKLHNKNVYTFNQFSIQYLSLCCQRSLDDESMSHQEKIIQLYQERIKTFQKMGIDVNSCVYFLMDFYSRWILKPHTQSIHVLLEVVNSMLIISDLFTEISQYTWFLESGIILWQKHHKDNDTVFAFLIVIICKAAAAFVPIDPETRKLVVRVLRSGLNNKYSFVQNAALHGLLYLLEKIFKKNLLNDREYLNGEFETEILSSGIVYVLQNLNVDMLETFEKETADCLISVSFYLIEYNACGDNSGLLIDRLLKLSVRACKLKLWDVHSTIIQGFYNLLLFDNERIKEYNNELGQLVKEILSTVSCPPSISIQCMQMLATCMYLSDDFENRTNESANESFDTEKLVSRMEKISFFFKRIKKGTKSEAHFLCILLPQILIDLFPSSEILNKVILEFLSPSQRFPELMAEIMFKVFQHMIEQSELSLIQDWVLSLLNNSRNYPIPKAVFYLTCFFVSACTNPWLTAFFPVISLRYSEVKYEDRKLLCLSAAHFYSQLKNDSQKNAFIATFQSTENNNLEDPLSDILKMIV